MVDTKEVDILLVEESSGPFGILTEESLVTWSTTPGGEGSCCVDDVAMLLFAPLLLSNCYLISFADC